MNGAVNFPAGGNVAPFTIVRLSADKTVSTCGDNELAVGVSTEQSRAFDSTLSAIAGELVSVESTFGTVVRVRAGGTIAAGAKVRSGANGLAVAAATSGATAQNLVGVALEAAVSGDIFLMQLNIVPVATAAA